VREQDVAASSCSITGWNSRYSIQVIKAQERTGRYGHREHRCWDCVFAGENELEMSMLAAHALDVYIIGLGSHEADRHVCYCNREGEIAKLWLLAWFP
jgi:hypothetical protein